MSKQIQKVIQNFSEKITELSNQTLNPYEINYADDNKKLLLNRTNKSKSQHLIQKNSSNTQSNQPSTNTDSFQRNSIQSNLLKENSMISKITMTENQQQKVLQTNDLKEINQLINQKKKEMVRKNTYYLQEISKIRQDIQLNTKIRNKLKNEKKSTTSSQDKYEKCWDETIKEINQEKKEKIIEYEDLEISPLKQQKLTKKQKPLRSQIFYQIREQENKYFNQRSDYLIKKMKQKSKEIVDELTSHLESVSIISKEKQLQRSKEREEGKQEIINSFKSNGQKRLVKLLQNQQSYRYKIQNKRILDKSNNQEQNYQDISNSYSKRLQKRSQSQNCLLPQIDKSDIHTKKQEFNNILQKIVEKKCLLPNNIIQKQSNYFRYQQKQFSNIIQFE